MSAESVRVDDAYSRSRRATWLLVGALLLSLGGLVVVQVRLAQRTHRYLNLPLAGATAGVFAVLLVGTIVMAIAQNSANRVYDTSYTDLRNLATARIEAYTAKSAESISLIYRGTGGDYAAADKRYAQATEDAKNKLGHRDGLAQLTAWRAAHDAVFQEAAGGLRTPGRMRPRLRSPQTRPATRRSTAPSPASTRRRRPFWRVGPKRSILG